MEVQEQNKLKLNNPFRGKFYNITSGIKDFLSQIKRFSLKKFILESGLEICQKFNLDKGKFFFESRLEKLNQIRNNVLSKYIVKEMFLFFLVCFGFFFVVFFVNTILLLVGKLLEKRAPFASVMKILWYNLPAVVAQSTPYATLLGFLMCIGRMVTDNEILILRASGLRYSIVFKPVLVLGLLISLFSFVVNDYFLPLGTMKSNRMYRKIVSSNPAVEIESYSIKRMKGTTLVIGNVNKEKVSDLIFFDTGDDNSQRIIVAQDTKILKSNNSGILMELEMADPVVINFPKRGKQNYDIMNADLLEMNIFEDQITIGGGGNTVSEMTSWDAWKKIRADKKRNHKSKASVFTFHRKFSLPFASIFFALLAFPLALVLGKKDGQTLGFLFGIIICFLYWTASMIGSIIGMKGDYNLFLIVWAPNFIIGILGAILYLRLRKK